MHLPSTSVWSCGNWPTCSQGREVDVSGYGQHHLGIYNLNLDNLTKKSMGKQQYNLKLRARSGYSLLNHLTRGTPSLENMTRVQRISSSHIRPWEITMRLSGSNKATVAVSWAKARSTRAVEYYGAIHTVKVYWKRLQKTTFERFELGIMRRHSERQEIARGDTSGQSHANSNETWCTTYVH